MLEHPLNVSKVILDPVEWRNSRPTKRMGAGLLIRNPEGAVLIVEPSYKDVWEIPGGSVEKDESPLGFGRTLVIPICKLFRP